MKRLPAVVVPCLLLLPLIVIDFNAPDRARAPAPSPSAWRGRGAGGGPLAGAAGD